MDVKIKVVGGGQLPEFKRVGDACADCHARCDGAITILPRQRKLIPLGFVLELPDGYEAVIRPRSGESLKGHDVCIGTVDSNYRGEIMANLINNANEPFVINNGDRVCQMAIRKTEKIIFVVADKLNDSVRGEHGFGSTGL